MKQYCISCMKELNAADPVCPHCGFDRREYGQPEFALSLGSQLHAGKYLVGKVLGQGGFGITYVGLDQSLGLKVAIKEYFPTSMASRPTGTAALQWHSTAEQRKTGRDSFVKEARKMAKIHHIPNVVEVRDVFYENETAYIVMDFVEGETLKDRLAKTGPMGETDCVALLRSVMEALGKAHERGIIHRDISPDNIMIDGGGAPWLLDMGAAKELDLTSGGAMQSSQLVVKHGFSPPEQSASAGKIGPWTDVYAMCATVYYCVTGKLAPDAMDRMLGTPLVLPPLLSENLAAVLERGLALRPGDRIQSMGELMSALARTGPESEPEPELEPESEPEFELEPGPGPEPEPGPEVGPKPVPDPKRDDGQEQAQKEEPSPEVRPRGLPKAVMAAVPLTICAAVLIVILTGRGGGMEPVLPDNAAVVPAGTEIEADASSEGTGMPGLNAEAGSAQPERGTPAEAEEDKGGSAGSETRQTANGPEHEQQPIPEQAGNADSGGVDNTAGKSPQTAGGTVDEPPQGAGDGAADSGAQTEEKSPSGGGGWIALSLRKKMLEKSLEEQGIDPDEFWQSRRSSGSEQQDPEAEDKSELDAVLQEELDRLEEAISEEIRSTDIKLS